MNFTLDNLLAHKALIQRAKAEARAELESHDGMIIVRAIGTLNANEPTCYGISDRLAHYSCDMVDQNTVSLKTGGGLTPPISILQGCRYTVMTPSEEESASLTRFVTANGLSLEGVEFILDDYSNSPPQSRPQHLDFVLLDSKHTFPWPINHGMVL